MSILVVRRKRDSAACYRAMEVLVDGQVVGALKRDSHLIVELDPGPHIVQGRMDWATSRAFRVELNDGESVVALACQLSSLVRSLLDPKDAFEIELERGIGEEDVTGSEGVRPRKRYWPRIVLGVVGTVILFWLSRTGAVPMAVNVVAGLAVVALFVFCMVKMVVISRRVRDIQQRSASADAQRRST